MHNKDVRSATQELLRWFDHELQRVGMGLPSIPPIPVREIALLLNLTIESVVDLRDENGNKLSGLLVPDKKAIRFEAGEVFGRQNFTIAHEIGHYVLHYAGIRSLNNTPSLFELIPPEQAQFLRCTEEDVSEAEVAFKDYPQVLEKRRRKVSETQANIFAAELLMPSDEIREWHKRFKGDVDKLAHQFEVSGLAMRNRLKYFSLSKENDTRQARIAFWEEGKD